MSADNYPLIRELSDGRWILTDASASCDWDKNDKDFLPTQEDVEIAERLGWIFDSRDAAFECLSNIEDNGYYFEYGLQSYRFSTMIGH